MKKLIYLLFVFTLISCSSSDDDADIVKVPTTFEEAAIGQWVAQITDETRMAIEITLNDSSVYTSVGDACFTQTFSDDGDSEIIKNTISVLETLTTDIPVASIFSGEQLVVLRNAGILNIDARSTYSLVGSIINFTYEYYVGDETIILSGTFIKKSFNKC